MELKKGQKLRDGIIYEGNVKIGQCDFEISKVEKLGYQSLTKKVMSILNGNAEFHADESLENEYDEPEANDYSNVDEDSLEFETIDEYSDKFDLVDRTVDIASKVEATRINEGLNSKEEVKAVENSNNSDKEENKTNES